MKEKYYLYQGLELLTLGYMGWAGFKNPNTHPTRDIYLLGFLTYYQF